MAVPNASNPNANQTGGNEKKGDEVDSRLKQDNDKRRKMESALKKHGERRRKEKKETALRQQIEVEKEGLYEKGRQREMREFRKKEVERKKEIEEMKKRKKAESDLIMERRTEKQEYEKKHKEYMQTLQWASKISSLKEKKKQDAHKAKLSAISGADTEAKMTKERARQDDLKRQHEIEAQGRKERGDLESEELGVIHEIEKDIQERKAKIFIKERQETGILEAELMRKRSILRQIQDPSLLQRTKDELKRTERQLRNRLKAKYQKQATDLEVERTQRIDDIRRLYKKTRGESDAQGRDMKQKSKQMTNEISMSADMEYHAKVKSAKELESEILSMTSEEVAQWRKDQNNSA